MKQKFSALSKVTLGLLLMAFVFSGCYESHYYHHYHHHTRPWYDHRHRQPPSGVNFDIDVYKR